MATNKQIKFRGGKMNLLPYGVLFTIITAFVLGFGMGRDFTKKEEEDD